MRSGTLILGLSLAAATLVAAGLATAIGPVAAQQATATPEQPTIDVEQLFATTCGWCHSDRGREAGKGPKLMGTARSDDFIRNRIKNGKEGAMPAFGDTFSDADLDAIIKYIRDLKPDQG